MEGETRHPVIVDTDALIAVANTRLWSKIVTTLNLTTTNVCVHELKRHTREKSEYAADGTREQWIYEGSETALEPFEDDSNQSFIAYCTFEIQVAGRSKDSLATAECSSGA